MNRVRWIFIAVSLALVSLLTPGVLRAQTSNVTIQNFAFNPSTLTISVGESVTWTNTDNIQHTTTSDTGLWDSGPLAPNQSFKFTFNQAGTYTYHCNIHPSMTGSIVVQAAAANTPTATSVVVPPPPPPGGSTSPTDTPTAVPTETPTAVPTNTPPPSTRSLHLAVSGSLSAGKNSTLNVTVTDAKNHHAVSGASLTLSGPGIHKLTRHTNSHGKAKLTTKPGKPGTATLTVKKSGYHTVHKHLKVK